MNITIDNKSVIVFDLDDTLYSELDYLKSGYRFIAELLDRKKSKKLYATMLSLYRNKKNVFDFLSDRYNITMEELIYNYRNHDPKIKPRDGCIELLKAIKEKGGFIAVITDGRIKTQNSKIISLKIKKYIDYVVISEEIKTEKPNSKAFQMVENKIEGTSFYYIGDNVKKDFIAPNSLGWKTIGLIDDGKNIHCNFHNYQNNNMPNDLIYDLNEIVIL